MKSNYEADYLDDRLAGSTRILALLRALTSAGDRIDVHELAQFTRAELHGMTVPQVSASLTVLRRTGYLEMVGRHGKAFEYAVTGKVFDEPIPVVKARPRSRRNRRGGYRVYRDPEVLAFFVEE